MDETLKQTLENIYKYHCFMMADTGKAPPMVFIFKDSMPFPIYINEEVEMGIGQYISCAIDIAKQNSADGIAMVYEQQVGSEKYSDEKIKNILEGVTSITESENKKEHLVLSYTESNGKTHMLMGEIEKDDGGVRFVKNQKWTDSAYNNIIIL